MSEFGRKMVNKMIHVIFLCFISVILSLIFDQVILRGVNHFLLMIQEKLIYLNPNSGVSNYTIFRYFNKTSEFSVPRIYFFSIIIFFFMLHYFTTL